jgi:multiple antibiotic resistance protein
MAFIKIWLTTFGVILAVIDPFGYIPLFLAMTPKDGPEKRRTILLRACVTAGVVLVLFMLVGDFILSFFGISIPALQISGGLILLFIGLDMVRVLPITIRISEAEESEAVVKDDPSIVPLAIPMLAGPASLTTVAVFGARANGPMDYVAVFTSISITLILTYFILRNANRVLRIFTLTGLNVLTRIMGLLLCAMAVQFILNGFQQSTR